MITKPEHPWQRTLLATEKFLEFETWQCHTMTHANRNLRRKEETGNVFKQERSPRSFKPDGICGDLKRRLKPSLFAHRHSPFGGSGAELGVDFVFVFKWCYPSHAWRPTHCYRGTAPQGQHYTQHLPFSPNFVKQLVESMELIFTWPCGSSKYRGFLELHRTKVHKRPEILKLK